MAGVNKHHREYPPGWFKNPILLGTAHSKFILSRILSFLAKF